jgi:hypothetical protein
MPCTFSPMPNTFALSFSGILYRSTSLGITWRTNGQCNIALLYHSIDTDTNVPLSKERVTVAKPWLQKAWLHTERTSNCSPWWKERTAKWNVVPFHINKIPKTWPFFWPSR